MDGGVIQKQDKEVGPCMRRWRQGKRREVQPKQTEGVQSFALASVTDYFQLRVKECYC